MFNFKRNLALFSSILSVSFMFGCAENTVNSVEIQKNQATETAIQATMAPKLEGPNIVPDSFTATDAQIQQLADRNKAVQFFEGLFLRDPYIFLGPDDTYYFTSTRLDRIKNGDSDNHLTEGIELWKSDDLLNWELVGVPFTFNDLSWKDELTESGKKLNRKPMMWAPEIHYINGKWVLTHTTSVRKANILLADKPEGPYREVFEGSSFGHRHDPTFYTNHDGRVYLLSKHYEMIEMAPDLKSYIGDAFRVEPSNRKIGHEGLSMAKIFDKYIIFGTAWSSDILRRGTYNMYYAVSDNMKGPYSERKFLGRFLGHGTPFKDKNGNWWVTAFKNGEVFTHEEINARAVQDDIAYTPMSSGFMLVPIEPKLDANGDFYFDVLDERYKYPGPEEVQKFKTQR